MKLKVANQNVEQEPEVELEMHLQDNGSVCVFANGVELMWIQDCGRVLLNRLPPDARKLSAMGFKMDGEAVMVE